MKLSKHKIYGIEDPITQQLLKAFVAPSVDPGIIAELKLKHRSILLNGALGTGKILLAQSLGKLLCTDENNIKTVSGREIEGPYIGQSESNIRNLFKNAKHDWSTYGIKSSLHLVTFDEIDSVARKRDSSSHSKLSDRCVQQLLSCLDGASRNELGNILPCHTTNRYSDLDSAILRPGCFGTQIQLTFPVEKQRQLILKEAVNKFGRDSEIYIGVNNIDITTVCV